MSELIRALSLALPARLAPKTSKRERLAALRELPALAHRALERGGERDEWRRARALLLRACRASDPAIQQSVLDGLRSYAHTELGDEVLAEFVSRISDRRMCALALALVRGEHGIAAAEQKVLDADPVVALAALEVLLRVRDPDLAAVHVVAVGSACNEVEARALSWLERSASDRVVGVALERAGVEGRRRLVSALSGRIGAAPGFFGSWLSEESEPWRVHAAALIVGARRGGHRAALGQACALAGRYADESPQVAVALLWAARRHDLNMDAIAQELLSHPQPEVRLAALHVLEASDEPALKALREMASDEDPRLRRGARASLRNVRHRAPSPGSILDEVAVASRAEAWGPPPKEVMERMGAGLVLALRLTAGRDQVGELSTVSERAVEVGACLALSSRGDEAARARLSELSEDEEPAVASAAEVALRELRNAERQG